MNQVNIIGTMTKDCELKFAPSGTPIGSFGIAYNERYKKQDGTPVDKAHFFDVTVIGKKAEVVSQYFKKGSRIGITGSLDFQQWQDQQGNNRSKVGIKLNDFTFIDRKSDNQQTQQQSQKSHQSYNQQPNNQQQQTQGQQQMPTLGIEEEIPF